MLHWPSPELPGGITVQMRRAPQRHDRRSGSARRLHLKVGQLPTTLRNSPNRSWVFAPRERQPNLVLDHEVRQLAAVNEHDALDRARELDCLMAESRCRYEHASVCALASQRTIEGLHLWSTYRALPPLRLYVHLFEAKTIKRNYSVNAAIARTAHTQEVGATSPVTSGRQNFLVLHQPCRAESSAGAGSRQTLGSPH